MQPIIILLVLLLAGIPLFAAKSAPAAPPDAGRVIAYTAWTPTLLYVAFRVDDRMVVGNQTLPASQPWLDDAVAVYLNLTPNQTQRSITTVCAW